MPAANSPQPTRFQFSLAGLLLVTTIAAVLLGLFTTPFGSIAIATFSWIILYILLTVALSCVIYGRGDLRAAATGALLPVVPLVIHGPSVVHSSGSVVATAFNLLVTAAICGLAAAITRRWLAGNTEELD